MKLGSQKKRRIGNNDGCSWLYNVTSAVKNTMSNVFGAVRDGFSKVKEHITGLASQAFNWGKDLIMGIGMVLSL